MRIVQLTNMLPKTARLKLIFLHRGLNDALDSCQEMLLVHGSHLGQRIFAGTK